MNEQTFVDKSTWDDGPWQSEPDRLHWIDPDTGLDCLIVRNPGGALCGYVGVPEGHVWHGADYYDVDADVHGGLTYADSCQKDDGHICHTDAEAANPNVWWLGFDCAHYGDLCPGRTRAFKFADGLDAKYRDLAYVSEQVSRLAAQVLAA